MFRTKSALTSRLPPEVTNFTGSNGVRESIQNVAEFHFITIPKESTLRGTCTFNGPVFVEGGGIVIAKLSKVIDTTIVSSVNRVADISSVVRTCKLTGAKEPVLGHWDNGMLGPAVTQGTY